MKSNLNNPGAHGFSEVLYAFSSAGNNNGSAFAGLTANAPFYNTALGLAMLIARYWLIDPGAGDRRLAGPQEDTRPPGSGTLPTHTPLFVVLLVGIGPAGRRADVRPGAGPGADRRTPANDGDVTSSTCDSLTIGQQIT